MDCCGRKTERNIDTKNLINGRINKISGQLNGVKKMIDSDRYCEDVLIQLLAIEKSVNSLSKFILDNHMHNCLINKIEKGEYEIVDEICDLIKRFH